MKAKELKRRIYGECSTRRSVRKYIIKNIAKPQVMRGKIGDVITLYPIGTLANHPDSPRAKYQQAKRSIKRERQSA